MKREIMAKKAEVREERKEIFNKVDIEFNSMDYIFEKAYIPENNSDVTIYPLAQGINLSIVRTDKETDYGTLNVLGVAIMGTIRNTKKGFMFSYPQYKKDGEWKQYVTNYSKEFNAIIKDVLTKHYELEMDKFMEVSPDEVPFE